MCRLPFRPIRSLVSPQHQRSHVNINQQRLLQMVILQGPHSEIFAGCLKNTLTKYWKSITKNESNNSKY